MKPQPGSLWRHKAKNRYYEVIVVANDQADWHSKNWPEIVVYKETFTGNVWARPLVEFLEKFEEC